MLDQRKTSCRGCRTETLHHRFRWQGLWAVQMLGVFGGCWACWPVVFPVALLVFVADPLRPHRCDRCGRRTWRRGAKGP